MKKIMRMNMLPLMNYMKFILMVSYLPTIQARGYKGPLAKTWTNNQCRELRSHFSDNPEDCMEECSQLSDCNAFTFNVGRGCNLLKCRSPVPDPTLNREDYYGYYFDPVFYSSSGYADSSSCQSATSCDIIIRSSAPNLILNLKNVNWDQTCISYVIIWKEIETYYGGITWSSTRTLKCSDYSAILSPGIVRLLFQFSSSTYSSGMNISWTSFDGYEINSMEKSGVILSPGYPELFINAVDEEKWNYTLNLYPPNGLFINLNLTDFNKSSTPSPYMNKDTYIQIRNEGSVALQPLLTIKSLSDGKGLILGTSSLNLGVIFSKYQESVKENQWRTTNVDRDVKISFKFSWTIEPCQKEVNISDGNLKSPSFPKKFIMQNTNINWVIGSHLPPNSHLVWSISLSNGYAGSFELRNGFTNSSEVICSNSGWNIRQCGVITTGSSRMSITYIGSISEYASFEVNWEIEKSPMIVNSTEGIIQSHGFPLEFMGYNYECGWIISPDLSQNSKIMVNFTDFSTNSPDIYMEIRDGPNNTAPLIQKFSGRDLEIPRIFSSGDQLYVKFTSSNSTIGPGGSKFKLHWSVKICRMDLNSTKGVIRSLEYPKMYPINLQYIWTITSYSYTKISIRFTTFDTLDINNFLELRGGANRSSTLIKKFYGRNQIIQDIIYPGNSLFLEFKTDYSTVCKGFEISWEIVYGDKFTSPSGILHSPGFPLQYPDDLFSVWTITSLTNARIRLNFSFFDTEYFVDNLEIRNGILSSSPLITKLSGENLTLSEMVSPGSQLFLRFTTDHSHAFRGFQITWSREETQIQDIIAICQVASCPKNSYCQVTENKQYECLCNDGYAGPRCQATCILSGCPANAECVINMNTQYECLCKEGYIGHNCQPTCILSGCPEHAECVLSMNSQYGCVCKEEHTGHNCQQSNIGKGDISLERELQHSDEQNLNHSNSASVVALLVLILLLIAALFGLAIYNVYNDKKSKWGSSHKADTIDDGDNLESQAFSLRSIQSQDDH